MYQRFARLFRRLIVCHSQLFEFNRLADRIKYYHGSNESRSKRLNGMDVRRCDSNGEKERIDNVDRALTERTSQQRQFSTNPARFRARLHTISRPISYYLGLLSRWFIAANRAVTRRYIEPCADDDNGPGSRPVLPWARVKILELAGQIDGQRYFLSVCIVRSVSSYLPRELANRTDCRDTEEILGIRRWNFGLIVYRGAWKFR